MKLELGEGGCTLYYLYLMTKCTQYLRPPKRHLRGAFVASDLADPKFGCTYSQSHGTVICDNNILLSVSVLVHLCNVFHEFNLFLSFVPMLKDLINYVDIPGIIDSGQV